MNRYRRFYLLLCSLLVCCVGFFSVGSMRVYAYTGEDGFYPFSLKDVEIHVYDTDFNCIYSEYDIDPIDNIYYSHNPQLDNIYTISFDINTDVNVFVFPYNPTVYDYYFLGSVVANCDNPDLSTFKPSAINIFGFDVSSDNTELYNVSDVTIYDIDNRNFLGYGFSQKMDFSSSDNVGISNISMSRDADGSGSKPPELIYQFGMLAVEKGQSETAVMSQILNQLQNMEQSINSSIGAAADQVTDAIENQYNMGEAEDFGVGQLTDQVEEKLGVLTFGADTLNNFLGLFQASNAGGTELTFPGFSIEVQGVSYRVWPDMSFDLAFLEEHFGVLITAVRTVTVLCVWLAVLGYLVRAKDHFINNKG